ncbi:amino acid transporter, partial [Streptomyces griseus]|nr:amino acid transporter [Streptomyces griseus]
LAVALFVWLLICFTHLRMRGIILRETPGKLVVRMWLFPYPPCATIAMIPFLLVYMLTDHTARQPLLLSFPVAAPPARTSLFPEPPAPTGRE